MRDTTIHVATVLNKSKAVNEEDGQKIYDLILKGFLNKQKVTLAFDNMEVLSEEFLQGIQAGFDEARKQGIKVNPRVVYNSGPHLGSVAEYGDDAPLHIVLQHIAWFLLYNSKLLIISGFTK